MSLIVPTVERELSPVVFCPMVITGASPSMESTSGRFSFPVYCREKEGSVSKYLHCPSLAITSNAKLDFPEPDSPVITINLFLGISKSMFFRLCILAPLILINPGLNL